MQMNGKLRQNLDVLPVTPDLSSSSQVRFLLLLHTFFRKACTKKQQALGDVTKGIDSDHTHRQVLAPLLFLFFFYLLQNMWKVQQADKYFIFIF